MVQTDSKIFLQFERKLKGKFKIQRNPFNFYFRILASHIWTSVHLHLTASWVCKHLLPPSRILSVILVSINQSIYKKVKIIKTISHQD